MKAHIIKRFSCLICFILTTSVIFGDGKQPFNFYVPVQGEINAFFNLQKYLNSYDSDTNKKVDEIQLKQLLDTCAKNDLLQTYYVLEFIKNTKNSSLQKYYIQYCKDVKNPSNYFKITLSVLQQRDLKNNNKLLNGKKIEDINYSSFLEIALFNNQLNAMVLNSKWENYNISNETTESIDKSVTGFITGGGTNSISMTYRYYDETLENYTQRIKNGRTDNGNFDNASLMELPLDGFLKLSNSSKTYLWIGSSKDSWSIKNGQIVLNMYSEKYNRSYEVVWFINFSELNLYYDNPEFIWEYLSEIILLTWID